ncbi:thiamine phosphate synthase [Hyphomonas sp.]|uniref:thiamine phosphate synthase n=1 Tax=Hyphomonas sp. TaxID=87 RepID=UPI00391AC864
MSEEPQTGARRKAARAAREAGRHLPAGLPPAFFLTDPARTPDPAAIAAGLPRGWGVIYRHFGAPDQEAAALELAAACRARGLVLLIGADARLAMQVGADGVHWPSRLAGAARRWAGRFGMQTASAHGRAELARLAGLPVEAALVSAVFPSASPSAGAAMGPLRLRQLARLSPVPVYGLGGVNADNARRISGFAGLAAIEGWRCFGGQPASEAES